MVIPSEFSYGNKHIIAMKLYLSVSISSQCNIIINYWTWSTLQMAFIKRTLLRQFRPRAMKRRHMPHMQHSWIAFFIALHSEVPLNYWRNGKWEMANEWILIIHPSVIFQWSSAFHSKSHTNGHVCVLYIYFRSKSWNCSFKFTASSGKTKAANANANVFRITDVQIIELL